MSQSEDMDAINAYIAPRGKAQTSEAMKLRDAWIVWHDNLGWWERGQDEDIYDQARNRRNEYDLANAKTQQRKDEIKVHQQSGKSTEEMQDEPDRRLASGKYSEDEKPWIPTWAKWAAGGVTALAVGLFAWKAPEAIAKIVVGKSK